MNNRQLVLTLLAAANGRAFTPVQLQKSAFLVCENLADVFDENAGFAFEPYDYGPFDAQVYAEARQLRSEGNAYMAPSDSGRWCTYAATPAGIEEGERLLNDEQPETAAYIRSVVDWVLQQDFATLVRTIYEHYPQMRARSVFRG